LIIQFASDNINSATD